MSESLRVVDRAVKAWHFLDLKAGALTGEIDAGSSEVSANVVRCSEM